MRDPSEPRRIRVTFLAWRDLGHPENGGSERYVHEIARRLAADGHVVTLRTAAYPGALSEEVLDGVRHVRRGGRLSVYRRGLAHLFTSEGRGQDVVVDVVNGLPFGSALVRRRGTVALVHHLHRDQWQMIYPDWRGRLGWWVESVLTPRLYHGLPHVTVSQVSRADLIGLGHPPAQVSVVRNGLTAPVARVGTRSPDPRLVVLARLVPHKQIEHVLRLAADLRNDLPDLVVDVIGQGWWAAALRAEAERLDITDRVVFHGHLGEAERDRLLGRAWLMVLPSVREGWGIAVTEAAAMATPTLGYRSSGGLVESVTDGQTGWLVDDYPQLLARAQELLRDPEALARAGDRAREGASHLDWGRSAQEFAGVVAQAGQARRGQLSGRRRR